MMKTTFSRNFKYGPALAAGVLALSIFTTAAHAQTELTVYSAIVPDDLGRYAAAFEKDNPGIKIKWARYATGTVVAKLLAEKDNPQGDVIWGVVATQLMNLKAEGITLPYSPKGVERLDKRFVDTANPPHWVGMNAFAAVICFNTVEAKKKGMPVPKSWKDLTNPVFKDSIVMPNPTATGTGFLAVSSWLQLYGESNGWKFMDDLDKNMARYTASGMAPCKQAGSGEAAVGISFEFAGSREKSAGAPLEIILPSEGVGWDMEATSIIKGTKKLDAAKKLVDWTISDNAMKVYSEGYAVVAVPKLGKPAPHVPTNLVDVMIKNDFEWAAKNQKAILDEWKKRYDAKTEKK